MGKVNVAFNFIEIISNESEEISSNLSAMNFFKSTSNINHILYQQNKINILLCAESAGKSNKSPYINGIGFLVDNKAQFCEKFIAEGYQIDEHLNTNLPFCTLSSPGNFNVYITTEQEWADYVGHIDVNKEQPSLNGELQSVDHMAICCKSGRLDVWEKFLGALGLQLIQQMKVCVNGRKSTVNIFSDDSGQVLIPVGEAIDQDSHLYEFIENINSDGIQHIAFNTRNIVAYMRYVTVSGIDAYRINNEYYEDLSKETTLSSREVNDLKETGVLFTGDQSSYLKQIFLKDLFGYSAVEVIERNNHEGFGQNNIEALFKAAEAE